DQCLGYVEGGFAAWQREKLPVRAIPQMAPREVEQALASKKSTTIVDVRNQEEWQQGHIKQAQHLWLGELEKQAQRLAKNDAFVVTCASGMRAVIGLSILARQGFAHLT